MIKALGSDRPHPSLRDGVGPGRSERGANRCDAQVADTLIEDRSIPTVAVIDEKTRWLSIPTASLDDLLSRPLACRVARSSDMHDFPAWREHDQALA